MSPSTEARARRSARRLHRSDPTEIKGVGIHEVATLREVLAQLRSDLAAGHPVDAGSLDGLALNALIDGKPRAAQVLATLANGQRLEDILSELEARS
jgi:hypothetical protein